MNPMPPVENRPQSLALKYVLALATLALLAIGGQTLLQPSLARQTVDMRVVGQAGRQIQCSLELAGLARSLIHQPDPQSLDIAASEMRSLADSLIREHGVLATVVEREPIVSRLTSLESQLEAMDEAIARLESLAAADSFDAQAVVSSAQMAAGVQPVYRLVMDDMIRVHGRQTEARLASLRRTELGLLGLTLAVLLLQGILVFRPVVRQIHAYTDRLEAAEARLRQQQDMLLRISEHEQQKMGRDLHDRLGQQLTGIAFMGSLLQQKLRDGPYAADAKEITEMLQTTVRQTRDLARALFPAQIVQDGFVASLQELAESTGGRFDVDCQVRANGDLELADQTVATNLFRIAQEAVNNAARHGGASTITISVESTPGSLDLSVHDDGQGFPPDSPGEDTMGLAIMQERSDMIGAQLEITSQPQQGTTILCRVPHVAQDKETNLAHV